jgi:hypothetical protein
VHDAVLGDEVDPKRAGVHWKVFVNLESAAIALRATRTNLAKKIGEMLPSTITQQGYQQEGNRPGFMSETRPRS